MAIAKFCKLDLVVHESVRDDVIRDSKNCCCEIIKVALARCPGIGDLNISRNYLKRDLRSFP